MLILQQRLLLLAKEEAGTTGKLFLYFTTPIQRINVHRRSDSNIIGGHVLKHKKPLIVYSYKPSLKVDEDKPEDSGPAKGEIQERFNPRPYFEYLHRPPKGVSGQSSKVNVDSDDSRPPSVTYGVPFQPSSDNSQNFDSFTGEKPADDQDSYNSPYSSYNPPPKPADEDKDDGGYGFPPLAPPPSDDYGSSNDKPSSDVMPPSNSYLPPAEPSPPPQEDHDDSYSPPDTQGKGNSDDSSDDHKFMGPYAYQPSYEHHVPPSGSSYMPSDADAGPHVSYTVDPPYDGYAEHAPHGYSPATTPAPAPPPMAEEDLSPPPANDVSSYGQIPQYLDHDPKDHGYEFYGYDHHPPVYHEVEHPTTTEAMEDQRVNKGQYSYYYLGRKLWYIPLYFSIYFIIYVTVLILKSIARHKVQFKHHFTDKYRKSRTSEMDDLHKDVSRAVQESHHKYMYM